MLHHLSFGRRAVRINEDGVLRGRSAELSEIASLQRIQPSAFPGDDLLAQSICARFRRRLFRFLGSSGCDRRKQD
jgi:hypothetical protein